MTSRRRFLAGSLAAAAVMTLPTKPRARRPQAEEDPHPRRHRLPRAGARRRRARARPHADAVQPRQDQPGPLQPTSSSCTAIATATSRRSPAASGTWSSTTPATSRATSRLGDAARAQRRPLHLHLDHLGLRRSRVKPADESSPVAKLKEPTEKVTGESYGALKALCEAAASTAMPGRVTIVRPGLIVGPDDPTDRFTYWPVRLARGGEVLAPGESERSGRVHRRARSRQLDHLEPSSRSTSSAPSTRSAPRHATASATMLDGCNKGVGGDADAHLGRRRLPRKARRAAVGRHAGVDSARR